MGVLRIYSNPLALNANRNLKITGSVVAKSLERLSSGLRINRAADDAAGLSISEKLRGQIRGLNRASANALDGISLIQTAEGALHEVHLILQRTRELAVQAANGIHTADDRLTIQREVSQLADEIDRISKTTEFNTKTLLDGTLGALVSTDDYTRVRAAVTGNVGLGGNFVMEAVATTTGRLQVQKSDVFATTLGADAVGRINHLNTWRAAATITTANSTGTGNTGICQVELPNTAGGSIAVNSLVDGTLIVSNAVQLANGAEATVLLTDILQTAELSTGDIVRITYNDNGTVGMAEVALSNANTLTVSMFMLQIDNALALGTTATYATGTGIDLNLGAGQTILNTEFVDLDGSGSDFHLSFAADGASSNLLYDTFDYGFYNNGRDTGGAQTAGVGGGTARSTYAANSRGYISIGTTGAGNETGTIGVRFNVRHDWSLVEGAGNSAIDIISWDRHTGGNSLQDYGRTWQSAPAVTNGTYLIEATGLRSFSVYSFSNVIYTSLVAGGFDQTMAIRAARSGLISNTTGLTTFSIGEAFSGAAGGSLENVHLAFDGVLQQGETATFNVSSNNILTGDQLSTLHSLNRFQDLGVFNGRNNVEVTVYMRGTDRAVTLNILKTDTLEDLAGKLSLAIWDPAGGGVLNSTIMVPNYAPDLVHVNTIGLAKGTLSIVTPIPGAELVFAADEATTKALSLIEVREGLAPVYSINAFNLDTATSVGSALTDTNEITGLLPGLKLFFDNTIGLRLDPQPPRDRVGGTNTLVSFAYRAATEQPVVSLSGVTESFFVHVAPRDFSLQIGANEGQLITGYIRALDSQSLGVEGLLVVTSELAQEAISIVDHAISAVSRQRSRLGALQNRLESTILNLDVAAENLTSSESRIRDVDVAQETVFMTRNNILLRAGIAALSQANQLPRRVLTLIR